MLAYSAAELRHNCRDPAAVSAAEHCAPFCCTQQMVCHERMQEKRELHEALSSAFQPTWQSTADVSSMQQMCRNILQMKGGPQSSKCFDHSTELLVTVR